MANEAKIAMLRMVVEVASDKAYACWMLGSSPRAEFEPSVEERRVEQIVGLDFVCLDLSILMRVTRFGLGKLECFAFAEVIA